MSGVYFAYDGSIHGDWVSHYAARLASIHDHKQLHLVHVGGAAANRTLQHKIERIRQECDQVGVDLVVQDPQATGSLFRTLRSSVPAGLDSYLVCGTRSHERKQGLLKGSLSEALLRSQHCHVLAIRVVQPGLLGLPRRLLMPVSMHPQVLRSGLPFLRLFAPQVSRLHILHVVQVSGTRFRLLSPARAEALRQPGQVFCERIEKDLCDEFSFGADTVDAQAVVSDNVPKEIVIAATQTKSRLIYMGASERTLTEWSIFGNPIEQVLGDATCDVAIYRGPE